MKATEILEKLQNIFLSSEVEETISEAIEEATTELSEELESTEEVITEEVTEEVEAATEEVEEVEESEETEEVELSEETETEEVVEEAAEEVEETEEETEEVELAEEKEEEVQAPKYATVDEMNAMKNDILKAMESLMKDKYESDKEVPAQLSTEEIELSEEEQAEEFVPSPESNVEEKRQVLYSQQRTMTTKDRVFNKLFNN